MKYYVIEISNGAGAIKGKAIYEYETEKEAIATFHKKLGTAMSSDLYTSSLVIVINSVGSQLKREYYEVPTVEEPTVEVSEPL